MNNVTLYEMYQAAIESGTLGNNDEITERIDSQVLSVIYVIENLDHSGASYIEFMRRLYYIIRFYCTHVLGL